MEPEVTVLMSVYNASYYLSTSVDSILCQTFSDFEFIIIDDGSTDNSWELLNDYKDDRIKIIRNEHNIGLTKSLNKGLKLARGKYIARMDADDISLPDRLKKQKEVLDTYSKVAIVGSWVEEINHKNETIKWYNHPTKSYLIRWHLLFANAFTHSSVMMRKEAVVAQGGYSETLKYAQDFDLWSRISLDWDMTNIPEILVKWRRWNKGISYSKKIEQENAAHQIAKNTINNIWEEPANDNFHNLLLLLYNNRSNNLNITDVKMLISKLENLTKKFISRHGYTEKKIERELETEIITHLFTLIKNNQHHIVYRTGLIVYFTARLYPNIFNILWIYFSRRTKTGAFLFRFTPY